MKWGRQNKRERGGVGLKDSSWEHGDIKLWRQNKGEGG